MPMPRHSLPQLALPRFSPTPQVLAGAVVASGELDGVVLDTGANTFFGKTMALLAQPQERGHLNIVLGEQQGAWAQCGMADWLGSLGWEAGSCLHVVRQGRPSSLGCGGGLRGGPAAKMTDCTPSCWPTTCSLAAGRVGAAIGVLAAGGCITILAVIIARFDDVGYAFAVSAGC